MYAPGHRFCEIGRGKVFSSQSVRATYCHSDLPSSTLHLLSDSIRVAVGIFELQLSEVDQGSLGYICVFCNLFCVLLNHCQLIRMGVSSRSTPTLRVGI